MTDANIRIDPTVRERLKARGQKGETYSDIIEQLLDATSDADESPSADTRDG